MGFLPNTDGDPIDRESGLDCLAGADPGLIRDLDTLFRQEHRVEVALTEVRQRQAAAQLGQDRKSLDGLGRPRLEVDDYAYHYWGQRLGYQCWSDRQFVREFERDNPHARVKSMGTRTQVGYCGLATAGRGAVREVKRYAL